MFGTLATAVVYLLSLTAVFGIVGSAAFSDSDAPFSTAIDSIFGGTWAGYLMAAFVVISGFGALNGWTMICAEMPLAAANDGLFPEGFARLSRRGPCLRDHRLDRLPRSPCTSPTRASGYDVWNTLVYMTGITAAIPYAFSAMAQLKWRFVDHRASTRRASFVTWPWPSSPWSSRSCSSGTRGSPAGACGTNTSRSSTQASPSSSGSRSIWPSGKMTQPDPVPAYR